jgi:hypothetical protein
MARGATARAKRQAGEDEARRERLLRLLRLTSSDRDGEALAALRRATQLIDSMGLDWDALLMDPTPSEAALVEAILRGRLMGLREGRAEARCEAQAEVRRAYARGVREGEVRGRDRLLSDLAACPELARALLGGPARQGGGHEGQGTEQEVVAFPRPDEGGGSAAGPDEHARDRALIAAVLENPAAPPRTIAFVADLARWLDTRGPLTAAQATALRRTHLRWGRGAA